MKRLLVIYNPTAGGGRVRDKWPAVDGALRQAGVSFEAVATTAPLEAGMLARKAAGKYTGAVNYATIPKALKGMSGYLAAVLKTMIRYPRLRLSIGLDDLPPFEESTTMTAVTNGRCFGNGFWVCPDAKADDGLFDLMVREAVGRLTIVGLIPKFWKGTHVNEPVVKMYRASRVTLESEEPLVVEADGEIPYVETHRLEMELLPKKLPVFV